LPQRDVAGRKKHGLMLARGLLVNRFLPAAPPRGVARRARRGSEGSSAKRRSSLACKPLVLASRRQVRPH
jgi:hypothetical protein